MIYIKTNSTDPHINLAAEEYYLRNTEMQENVLMIWQNQPSIVVGRFQNILAEVNTSYAEEHQIPILRRISGGGTVFHDLGNVCFSFIYRNVAPHMVDVPAYNLPIMQALRQMGLPVETNSRNDLILAGKKFSGNAMALQKHNLLFHGTLLFNSDLTNLRGALATKIKHLETKGVKSVRSEVTNLKDHLQQEVSVDQFRNQLKQNLIQDQFIQEYQPTSEDLAVINQLAINKYQSWEWIYGNNPYAKFTVSKEFAGKKLDAHLETEKGLILTCAFQGDFNMQELRQVETAFKNQPYQRTELSKKLHQLELDYISNLFTRNDILDCVFGS